MTCHFYYLEDIGALGEMEGLKAVSLVNCVDLIDISVLARCKKLRSVQLGGCKRLSDVSALSCADNIECVDLSGTDVCSIVALGGLNKVRKLKKINIEGTRVRELDVLKNCKNLKELNVAKTRVYDLGVLSNFHRLKKLNIARTVVCDLSVLGTCGKLKDLNVEDIKVGRIRLEGLRGLKYLNVVGIKFDFSMMHELVKLKELHVDWTTGVGLRRLGMDGKKFKIIVDRW